MTVTATTTGSALAWDDSVLPFQLDHSGLRGRVVRLGGALDRILGARGYAPAVEGLVAEAALVAALIGQMVKLRWRLSLQIRGTGPVRLVAADYFAPEEPGATARIRACADLARDGAAEAPAAEARGVAGRSGEWGAGDAFALLGEGHMAVTLDQGPGTLPHQGLIALDPAGIAASASAYFARSEQIPTRFALAQSCTGGNGANRRAGGLMVQLMPGTDAPGRHADTLSGRDTEDWTRANLLLDTVEAEELTGPDPSPPELLLRLFHEEGPRVFEAQPLRFGCTCSEEKLRATLAVHGADEIAGMTDASGRVTADCHFCGAHYVMDPTSLGREADAERPRT